MYELEIDANCEEEIRKKCRRNPVLQEALAKKTSQILEDPSRFKPLHAPMQNQRRARVLGPFILVFEMDEKGKKVKFLRFAHHDEAYEC